MSSTDGSSVPNLPTAELSEDQLRLLLRKEYDQADRLCKEVERFREEAGIPGLNELRYAGYHTILHLTETEGQRDQLVSAINHCRRASYEASEAGILTALELIATFKVQYRSVVISDVISDWHQILVRCDEVNEEVSRARDNGPDRNRDHEQFMAAFRELKGYANRTYQASDELNKVIRNGIRTTRRWVVGLVVTIVLGILAIAVSIAVAG